MAWEKGGVGRGDEEDEQELDGLAAFFRRRSTTLFSPAETDALSPCLSKPHPPRLTLVSPSFANRTTLNRRYSTPSDALAPDPHSSANRQPPLAAHHPRPLPSLPLPLPPTPPARRLPTPPECQNECPLPPLHPLPFSHNRPRY